jgi:hypothetical protein
VIKHHKRHGADKSQQFLIFGSAAYAHVPDQRRTKLEDKSKMYIFIGYDEKTKGYKLLDPINKKVMVSRDVQVNEASEWDWNNSTEVNIKVGESSVVTSTSKQQDPETTDDEDEPKREVCKIYMIQQMRHTLYVFWQMLKILVLKRQCETRSGKLP